jgi:hypothetical protein
VKIGIIAYVAVRAWLPTISVEARHADVDELTLATIVAIESHGQAGLVSREKNGSCSVGLGMVNVPDCDPKKVAALRDPATNIRAAARTLSATMRWCKRHRADRYCQAGERVFKGGGGVNRYAGRSDAYARKVGLWRKALRKELMRRGVRVVIRSGA